MRSLARPSPDHDYDLAAEITRLRAHCYRVPVRPEDDRRIPPAGTAGHLLFATWNIANLGVHKRRDIDHQVIAEPLSWFELIAVQEVADNVDDFNLVMALLPGHFAAIYSDRGGNEERAAYIYDTRRVTLGPKIGEMVIVDTDRPDIALPGITRRFHGFNRNPYLASFRCEGTDLLLVNCHLFYGPSGTSAERRASLERRQLEAYAAARYCDLRRKDKDRHTANIIALGDFNLPRAERGDPIYDALTRRGLHIPPEDSRIPTNVSRDSDYDQVTVVPGLKRHVADMGVFDFDEVLFADIWDPATPGYWRRCAKYYVSDHRPVWMQLRLP